MSETAKGTQSEAGAPDEPKVEAVKKVSRVQEFLVEYGTIGIVVLLSISALTYLGFLGAILVGFEVEGAGEMTGALAGAAAAWGATKVIRIPIAIALTPVVAKIWHRVRKPKRS